MNIHPRHALRAVTAACCALGVAGCSAPLGAHPDTATPTAEAAGAALETLLLDDADVARIVDTPLLHSVDTYTAMPDTGGRTYSDPFCGAAISSASTSTYQPGTVADVRGRRLSDSDAGGATQTRSVTQSVITFHDAQAAREFIAAARTGWLACAGTSVEMRDDAGRAVWRGEQPRYERAVLSVAGTHRSGWGTEHAISAQGAIVIDVTVSGADAVAGRAETVVQHIAQRFSQ